MGKVVFSISMSLDGLIAGPDDRPGQGLGVRGDLLHKWVFEPSEVDRAILDGAMTGAGAIVVGRRMFDNAGAWGGNPPGGLPCFVLTHNPPQEWRTSDSPFTFVTDGIESAVAQARARAGDRDVGIGGGASTGQQALAAGVVDELLVHLAPVLLGTGIALFDQASSPRTTLERVEVLESPHATHLRFRVLAPEPARG